MINTENGSTLITLETRLWGVALVNPNLTKDPWASHSIQAIIVLSYIYFSEYAISWGDTIDAGVPGSGVDSDGAGTGAIVLNFLLVIPSS